MKLEAVLFDMDGTVLDTLEDLYNAVNHSLARFQLPPVSRERVRANLGNGAAHLIEGCLPPARTPELAERVLADYKPWYAAHCRIYTRPYPGIPELMRRLKAAGIRLAVVSNKPDGAVRELAEEHFPGLLEAAVGEREGVRRKPGRAASMWGIPRWTSARRKTRGFPAFPSPGAFGRRRSSWPPGRSAWPTARRNWKIF